MRVRLQAPAGSIALMATVYAGVVAAGDDAYVVTDGKRRAEHSRIGRVKAKQ